VIYRESVHGVVNQRLVKDLILPRLVFLPYIFAFVVSFFFLGKKVRRESTTSKLCIESGVKGWEIIEYKELYKSAIEYLGVEGVVRLSVKQERYLAQVAGTLKQHGITHYAYSPRTGAQGWMKGLWHAFGVLYYMQRYRVTPIVFLTDFPVRLWRAQSAIVTSRRGLVVTLMSPKLVQPIFPHSRLLGPYIMPFSIRLIEALNKKKYKKDSVASRPFVDDVVFVGALYEPRLTRLNVIKRGLNELGVDLKIKGRDISLPRVSDDEYWNNLMEASIVITTSDVMEQPGVDWPWLEHFVYRYFEVMACGAMLIAPKINGIERYFSSGVHYVDYDSEQDAIQKIKFYQSNQKARQQIATAGYERIVSLTRSRAFWLGIDVALRADSIT